MIYDVTVPITPSLPVWPTDPAVRLTSQSFPSSDGTYRIRVTNIEMGSHTGTHIDAPYHFIEGGRTLDATPLDQLVGPAQVVPIPGVRSITRRGLANVQFGAERILFKTDNSDHWKDGRFHENFVYLEPDAAELLVERGVRLVGIDYLSIDAFHSENHPSHFVLLGRNAVILEGLDLSQIAPGLYHMTALPLHIIGADGAPARVILENDR
ncbi:MAG TPA: cyclase family protein [Terriglobia bacterium]|nr:cyclase family protein [Terriglobia bacterium]